MSNPFDRKATGEFNPFIGRPTLPVASAEKARTREEQKNTPTQTLVPAQGLTRAPSQSPFADKDPTPVEILLHWLQHKWRGDTISWRDIRIWSPRKTRKPDTALELARILCAYGWLIPETPPAKYPAGKSPYRTRKWRIIRDENNLR